MTKYHVNWPSSSDPYYLYNTSENGARTTYYGVGSAGVPYLKVDGLLTYVGDGSGGANDPNALHNAINTRRAVASPCTIRVNASMVPSLPPADTVYVTVEVTADVDMHNTDQRLYVELIHRCHLLSGTTRYWMFRNMWPNSAGYSFQLDAGQTLTYSVACTTSTGWDINDLRIVAFVQRYTSKEVLQSGFAEVGYSPPVVINEFMAYAGDGNDWIEIFNAGDTDVNMLGKALTDQCSDPDKWPLPNTTLPAGGHLVVWHALTNTADTLVLYDNLASCYLQIDRKIYPAQSQNISYGRVCDGAPYWVQFMTSTPGEANSGCAGSVQNLSAVVEDNNLHLFWQPLYWPANYVIYRHDGYPFDPTSADSIGMVHDTSFVDPGILSIAPSAHYRVTAVPF